MVGKFDLIVVGAGAAIFATAMKANELKAKTLLINNNAVGLGGTCINVGCLPTKHLLYIAEQLYKANNNPFKGIESVMQKTPGIESVEIQITDLIAQTGKGEITYNPAQIN